jgi:WD40 repeat protein
MVSERRKPTTYTFHLFTLLFAYALWLSSGFAQNVTQWRVPDSNAAPLGTTTLNAITFSPDGSQVAVASTNGVALYNTYTGETLWKGFATPIPVLTHDVTAVVLSPAREKDGGQTVAVAAEDGTVHLWDARTGEHRANFVGHIDPVVALAFSPDGNILASGSFREIRLWDLTLAQAHRATVLHGHRDMVTTLAFSPDSKTLASTSFYGTILLWDVQTGQLRHRFPAHTDSILTLAFSPDNEILVSGGYWSPDAESTIRVWNPHTGQLLSTVENHTTPVFALAFSPDVRSRTLASAGWDNNVRLWHPQTGQLQATFESNAAPIVALAFLPDANGGMLASASLDGTIQLQPLMHGQRPADVNGDGVVNILDLTFLASRFGESSPDVNGDSIVNILDLVLVAQYIGQ